MYIFQNDIHIILLIGIRKKANEFIFKQEKKSLDTLQISVREKIKIKIKAKIKKKIFFGQNSTYPPLK